VNALDGVYLYDIDSLQLIAEQSLAMRREQVAAAEQIISQHVADFAQSIAGTPNREINVAKHPAAGESVLRASEL